jgi:hypothetical protein
VVIDPTLGDLRLSNLRNAMADGQWSVAREILGGARDHDDLSALLSMAVDAPGTETWLADVVREELESTTALLVYGARAVAWAWEARTGATAEHVSRDQFALFFERLRLAEDCLQSVVRREPGNATAWQQLIVTARGLQLGLAEARRRFDQAVAAAPGHYGAHVQFLQNACKKWSGSHEAMHEFARTAGLGAPAGSPLGLLIPMAYQEETLFLSPDAETRYMKQRAVRAALHEAADHSVRHPAYPTTGRPAATGHNYFAFAFLRAEEYKAAAEQFRLIGDRVTTDPWRYLADPGRAFVTFRNVAYAKA